MATKKTDKKVVAKDKKPAAITAKKRPAAKKASTKKTPNVASNGWPKIQQGTHLTVRTFEDGKTELIWDDEQLLKEVREAIANHELSQLKPAVKAKAITRKKKAS